LFNGRAFLNAIFCSADAIAALDGASGARLVDADAPRDGGDAPRTWGALSAHADTPLW